MRAFFRLTCAVLTVLVAVSAGQSEPPAIEEPAEFRLGLIASTTGALASFGVDLKNGVDLAVDELNAGTGIHGSKIRVHFHDIMSKPEEATNAAERLADLHVNAALGPVASSLALAAAPVFQRQSIPLLSPTATNPMVTKTGDFVFRGCYMAEFQAKVLAYITRNDLDASKAAIITNLDDSYSGGLAGMYRQELERRGGSVVAQTSFTTGTADFGNQVRAIAAAKPEVLFLPVYYLDVALIARELAAQNVKVKLLGCDGWESPSLAVDGGDSLEGAVFAMPFHPASSEAAKRFAEAYEEKYSRPPTALAALGYDSVMMLRAAAESQRSIEPAKIAEGLRAMTGLDGITGSGMKMTADRNPVKPIMIVKIEDKQVKYVRQVVPAELTGEQKQPADATD